VAQECPTGIDGRSVRDHGDRPVGELQEMAHRVGVERPVVVAPDDDAVGLGFGSGVAQHRGWHAVDDHSSASAWTSTSSVIQSASSSAWA
jgi:hypothetical protein